MKKISCIIIVLLLITGIAIMLYPMYSKNKTKQNQEKMLAELDEQIKKKSEKADNNGDDSENDEEGYNSELVKQEIQNLELEENDSSSETTTDKLLKEQTVIGKIQIPTIDIEYAIVEGSNRANIAAAIGHMRGTAAIGGEGNCVLAGHNGGIYGEFFKEIHKLKKDDKVYVTNAKGEKFTYVMYECFKVKPTDVYVTDNLEGTILTLITCRDNGKNRLVVRCRLN